MKVRQHLQALLLLLIFFVSSYKGQAQITIYQEGSYVKAEITPEEKDEIMDSATKILNSYKRVASFMDSDGVFSDDSYAEFVSLFTGSAEVYDDLAKKNATNINYASYADKVFQYMQGTGVRFELNETYLDEITYDSSGFYQVLVSFQKIMFNGLDEDNEIVNYPNNGKTMDLKMAIEIPEYDLSQAAILNILGEAQKVKVESASMISVDGNYHLGNVTKTASALTPGWTDDLPVDYNSYGVDALYRRSLNNKKTIFLLAGVSASFNNFTTNFQNIQASSQGVINLKNGAAGIDAGTDQPSDRSFASNLTITSAQTTAPNYKNDLVETLQTIDIQVPLGVSLRLVETYNWDIFLDVAVVPTYIISSSGQYSGNLTYLELPEDKTHFDEKFESYIINQFENGMIIDDYFGLQNYDEELVETASNFSASAQISPLIHYKFNFKMAFELGFNVSYGFLPYFAGETNHLGDDLSNILEITDASGAQNPSVLQNNYSSVSLLRYGARVGIVFKL